LEALVGVKKRWSLRVSGSAVPATAMTWSYRHPVVLLPEEAADWDQGRLKAVLLHELAHVRRADWVFQVLAWTACSVLWFNPAVWLATRAMRDGMEGAADDAVLAAGVRPSDYASVLLSSASEIRRRSAVPLLAGISVVSRPGIEVRIRAVLEASPLSRRASPADTIRVTAVACSVLMGMASVRSFASKPFEGSFGHRSLDWIAGFRAGRGYADETGHRSGRNIPTSPQEMERKASVEAALRNRPQ
jgi:beta-lactamase regulating signal transducer with metallopeptidase domain